MNKLVESVLKYLDSNPIKKSAPEREMFLTFIKAFYSGSQRSDFENYTPEELRNLALCSFELFLNKKPELKLQVFNYESRQEGTYAVLDIINNDMPFLVDSAVGQVRLAGFEIKNIIHPTYLTVRAKNGDLEKILDDTKLTGNNDRSASRSDGNHNKPRESVIQIHLTSSIFESELEPLKNRLAKIFDAVEVVVTDWKKMVGVAHAAASNIAYAKLNQKSNIGSPREAQDFVQWLLDGNFIFLGVKEFEVKNGKINEKNSEGLGVFRVKHEELVPQITNFTAEEVAETIKNPYVIDILKSRYKSQVHRVVNAERIWIQKFSSTGEIIGEYRFIGMFTSSAYSSSVISIPLIRNKISAVVEQSGFLKDSHDYKNLYSVLESYPKDELFQINVADLLRISCGIVAICGRMQVRLFVRKDKLNRFVSCLVFMPRQRIHSELINKVGKHLAEIFEGEVADCFIQALDTELARVHLIIRTEHLIEKVNIREIEHQLGEMVMVWSDRLKEALISKFDSKLGNKGVIELYNKYKSAFLISYISRFSLSSVTEDIAKIEQCLATNSVTFNLYQASPAKIKSLKNSVDAEKRKIGQALGTEEEVIELKIYSPNKKLTLSEVMPILESFGFSVIEEHTYVALESVWIHYFNLSSAKGMTISFSPKLKTDFESAIELIWKGITKIGFLNRLTISAGLNWKQVYLLRGYMRYIYQIGFRYDQRYISDVLVKYTEITKLLITLFETKFNPSLKADQSKIEQVIAQINSELTGVKDILEDSTIRKFLSSINATLRTNYYQTSGSPSDSTDVEFSNFKGYVSFKFDCQKIPNLPLPIPYAEIFVYNGDMEGTHLRGGRVARGGLRWSDRQEDFRTEVLGLMKAQMAKNTVIVPVGSKGGFVIKTDTSSLTKDQFQAEGIKHYKTLLRGLLDLTDNVIDGKIVPPKNTVAYDQPDPYLVVAADKGTASFSDIANSISAEYNFWLGDAFASGGSAGYDHKKMAITSRGAFISVARHFRELGIDIYNQDFTCVGIGDMSGDVFGNGMLLAKHTKLIAAFNHLHIFIDPNPDIKKAYDERKRLFDLPRSNWTDYDQSKISKGGGVFERSAKSITLSPEAKKALSIEGSAHTPDEIIKAILKAPVDLLWNGGIGTYLKAIDESNEDVGDRANNEVRLNGSEIRAKVVGEGGNLGCTQKGRIEYALTGGPVGTGGKINTDAIDNSAGVDCSDHEVNIKIALSRPVQKGKLTLPERNKILKEMTEEVADLVLVDNRLQTQAVSIIAYSGYKNLIYQSRFLDKLEKSGLLNRKIEFLPSSKEIQKRIVEKVGITRPEASVMLAYAKMEIYNGLLSSNLIDDEYFTHDLFAYFPQTMQKKFADEIKHHQLRREIIATEITNLLVNKTSLTLVNQLAQDTGFTIAEAVKSLIIAIDALKVREIWDEIEELDGKVAPEIQIRSFLKIADLLETTAVWLLNHERGSEIGSTVKKFQKIVDQLKVTLPKTLKKETHQEKLTLYGNEIGQELASKIVLLDLTTSAFDVAQISTDSGLKVDAAAEIYLALDDLFSFKWIKNKINVLGHTNYWQKMSAHALLEELRSEQTKLATKIAHLCHSSNCKEADALVEAFIDLNKPEIDKINSFIAELKTQPDLDLSMFIVTLGRFRSL